MMGDLWMMKSYKEWIPTDDGNSMDDGSPVDAGNVGVHPGLGWKPRAATAALAVAVFAGMGQVQGSV